MDSLLCRRNDVRIPHVPPKYAYSLNIFSHSLSCPPLFAHSPLFSISLTFSLPVFKQVLFRLIPTEGMNFFETLASHLCHWKLRWAHGATLKQVEKSNQLWLQPSTKERRVWLLCAGAEVREEERPLT